MGAVRWGVCVRAREPAPSPARPRRRRRGSRAFTQPVGPDGAVLASRRAPSREDDRRANTYRSLFFFLSHLEQTSRSQPFKTSYMTVFVKKNFFQYSSFWDCAKRIVSYDKLILKFFLFISKRKLLIKLYESKEAKQLRVTRCYWIIFTNNQITLHCSITTIKMK